MYQYLTQRKKSIIRVVVSLLPACMALGCSPSSSTKDTEQITVYTAVEADQLKRYQWELRKAHPELRVKWVRDSTGVISAKLFAEQKNPQADVVMGLALSNVLLMEAKDMLQPYKPKHVEQLKPDFYSDKRVPTWTGMNAWEAALCVNTVELKKRNLAMPQTWQDLAKPMYKNTIVMPNPVSSGTGYFDLSAWIQLFGEEQAWKYMQALDQNITQYVHSGSKPCKMAAQGETVMGISFGYPGYKLKARGAPLAIVYPTEGLGWEMEASAIIRGSKNLSSAKKFIDWSVSRAANEAYAEHFAIVAHQEVSTKQTAFPQNLADKLVKNDFYWAAMQRERILKRWSQQFEH